MNWNIFVKDMRGELNLERAEILWEREDEIYISVDGQDFVKTCLFLHKRLGSPVMIYFVTDERELEHVFVVRCGFLCVHTAKWVFITLTVSQDDPGFDSLAKEIYSAGLFEREMWEMYGVKAMGNPDMRRLVLHDEVWPKGAYPMRKNFKNSDIPKAVPSGRYEFKKVEGEGIFEVPVGPVHAGIIGPGHFRFSAAGEPIINLETRLGFTHRGVEKLFEGKDVVSAVTFSEMICGDTAFGYSLSLCQAIEKIFAVKVPRHASVWRKILLELERMYNHVSDMGGMAIDVGFSFPGAFAANIKEAILLLNEQLTGSRYLKNVNTIGGINKIIPGEKRCLLGKSIDAILKDFYELKNMLSSSTSFMDRVDKTGILRKDTAVDLGVIGLAARASGMPLDLRKVFGNGYISAGFNIAKAGEGDVLSRLLVRFYEFEESIRLIKVFLGELDGCDVVLKAPFTANTGFGLGYVEAWRGPILCWVRIDRDGIIDRCKIVDPSFHNWQALSFAALGNIIPDFPLCNKSFNLSYSGNDL